MEYQRLDTTYQNSHRSVPCQDTIRCNASTTHAHGETKDEQQSEHQTTKTNMINAIEWVDTSRDADGGCDPLETGEPPHFTRQQTGPPVVRDNDGLIDEKKCLQHSLHHAWTPPLRHGIENHWRTWRANGATEETRQPPSTQAPMAA